jgi:hypothetical protein
MFCPNCGAQNEDNVAFCRACGASLRPEGPARPGAQGAYGGAPQDDGKVGLLGVIFFCIPLVGAIMYFVWKDEKPLKAKKACNLALIGFVLGLVLRILASFAQN